MAKYQKYAEYKDSGVEWLGAIPGHWGVTQLKRLGKFITGMTPSTAVEAYYSDEITEYGWIRPEDILEESEKVEPTKFLTKLGWETQRTIPAQSTLICCIGTIGKLGFLGKRAVTNQQITALVPDVRGFSKYYYYLLTASRNQLEHLATGNVVKILNSERLGSLWLPLLSSQNEARQIVHFLDHETAKIDSLIEKQQQLIELLKEKRQAMISHAVTKGLNPDVPMKDSGVEWLGQVPEHWEITPLKHLCKLLKDGTHLPPPRVDEGIPLLSVRNIVDSKFIFRDDDSLISQNSYKDLCRSFIPQSGDVLLAIVGATLGKVAVIEDMEHFHIQRSLGIFRVDSKKFYNYYLCNVLSSKGFQSLLWQNVGFSAQPGIYLGALANFLMPTPPLDEQKKIVEFINIQVNKFEILINNAVKSVKFMQERRTALISAAVTGKIDVRNWQAPNATEREMEVST